VIANVHFKVLPLSDQLLLIQIVLYIVCVLSAGCYSAYNCEWYFGEDVVKQFCDDVLWTFVSDCQFTGLVAATQRCR